MMLPVATTLYAFIALYALRWLYLALRHRLSARKLGCAPVAARHGRLPLGIDNVLRMARAASDQVFQSDQLAVHREMGCPSTWTQNILGTWYVSTADPENVKAILATQFREFELGPMRASVLGPLLGRGIFTSDGEEWQHHRALLRPQFTRSQVSDLKLEEVHVQNLFSRIVSSEKQGSWTEEVDLGPLFFNLTLDSATEFLFGQSVESQLLTDTEAPNAQTQGSKETQKDWRSFGRAFDRANTIIALKSVLMDLHFLYSPKSFTEDCNIVHQFADHFVQQALRGEDKSASGAEEQEGYVFLRELAKTTQDPYELRSQLLNILLAGRDTTAGLLGWTFYLLARHPAYYAKLHTVIVETFGAYSSNASSITFESLKSCRPLQHLLSEVLRLHPVVPENSRRATRDTTLPRGGGADGQSPIYIRKGEEVIYSVNVMHRRKDIWGEDADEFRPGRWEEAGRRGWEYLPFNGGPRICLGQQFALTEAGYVLVRMVQRFAAVENLDGEGTVRHKYTLTTSPVKVLVRLREADTV